VLFSNRLSCDRSRQLFSTASIAPGSTSDVNRDLEVIVFRKNADTVQFATDQGRSISESSVINPVFFVDEL
jgi:hypothetical protein